MRGAGRVGVHVDRGRLGGRAAAAGAAGFFLCVCACAEAPVNADDRCKRRQPTHAREGMFVRNLRMSCSSSIRTTSVPHRSNPRKVTQARTIRPCAIAMRTAALAASLAFASHSSVRDARSQHSRSSARTRKATLRRFRASRRHRRNTQRCSRDTLAERGDGTERDSRVVKVEKPHAPRRRAPRESVRSAERRSKSRTMYDTLQHRASKCVQAAMTDAPEPHLDASHQERALRRWLHDDAHDGPSALVTVGVSTQAIPLTTPLALPERVRKTDERRRRREKSAVSA